MSLARQLSYKTGKNGFLERFFAFTRSYLNNKRISQQIAFISGHSLEQHSIDIFKMLQLLRSSGNTHTHELIAITLRLRGSG